MKLTRCCLWALSPSSSDCRRCCSTPQGHRRQQQQQEQQAALTTSSRQQQQQQHPEGRAKSKRKLAEAAVAAGPGSSSGSSSSGRHPRSAPGAADYCHAAGSGARHCCCLAETRAAVVQVSAGADAISRTVTQVISGSVSLLYDVTRWYLRSVGCTKDCHAGDHQMVLNVCWILSAALSSSQSRNLLGKCATHQIHASCLCSVPWLWSDLSQHKPLNFAAPADRWCGPADLRT